MKKIVWFGLPPMREIAIELPIASEIMFVDLNDGVPGIWVLVDTSTVRFERRRLLVEDGSRAFDGPAKYVGSVGFGEKRVHIFDGGSVL